MTKYIASIEYFDGTHQDINEFDSEDECWEFIENYERVHENECYLHLVHNDEVITGVCYEPSSLDTDGIGTIDEDGNWKTIYPDYNKVRKPLN